MSIAMARGHGLGRWALFGAMLASAGLPIYINAPKAYVDEYGVGLAALGLLALKIALPIILIVWLVKWLRTPKAGPDATVDPGTLD